MEIGACEDLAVRIWLRTKGIGASTDIDNCSNNGEERNEMRVPRMIIGSAATVAVLAGVSLATAGPAMAQATSFGTLQTLGSVCWGGVNSFAGPSYNQSGVVSGQLTFDKWTPTFGLPCTVGVSVNWRNLDNGATGTYSTVLSGNSTFEMNPQQFELPTGPGRVVLALNTDRPNLPVPDIEITVS